MSLFSDFQFHPKINQALDMCGYNNPTEIQAKSIPLILKRHDVIGATETGAGKTAAFVLPSLQLLATNDKPQKSCRILILTPTRELARQVTSAVDKYGKLMKLGTAMITGGESYKDQHRMLSRQVDIIVATPGRLIDYLKNDKIDLSKVDMFVLDEADRMLDMGFIDDVKFIASRTPKDKQTLLFTATLNKELVNSIGYLLQNPIVIDLSKPQKVPNQIQQQLYIANTSQQKITFLENLIVQQPIFKAIIFSATKRGADEIAYHLRHKGHNALALHGDLKQHVRRKSLEKLNSGKIQYLVATDVASRGIDIPNISHVINYDLPRCSEDYVHRVGRTGRAGRSGIAITIATRDERRYISSIEKRVGSKLQVINYDCQPEAHSPFIEEKKPSFTKRFSRKRPTKKYRD